MWEHEPVREACINCHNPHGSVNPAMLNSRPAQLCQSCHLTDNAHPADLMGNKPNEIMQVGKGCVNCHSQVDRKSTRLNSSHVRISYAVFCLKKKNKKHNNR